LRLPQPPLLIITDRRQARSPLETVVRQALGGGCRWVSLREKDLAPNERLALLRRLVHMGRDYGATVGVHEDVEAAAKAGARHLHLPRGADVAAARRHLGDRVIIGVSAHDSNEIAAAQRQGADYCTLSPIFPSPSKPGHGPALGVAELSVMARRYSLPIIALGGVESETVSACVAAGAAGVAVMGCVMRAADPRQAVRHLFTKLER
jgi:thiamine-phosphate pyrophosphorylase